MPQNDHLIGVISDTHGLLRPEAVQALAGVEQIIHAGDVGDPTILTTLQKIAPVRVVRGNVDYGPGLSDLPETEIVSIDDCTIYVLHNVDMLNLDPTAAGFHAVIFGHSHRPENGVKNGVRYLNPGSIGPRRFTLPVSLALVRVCGTQMAVQMVELNV